jgi:GGDEF domain-containing protein
LDGYYETCTFALDKEVSAEDDSSASYEGRLQIAPIQEAIFVQMLRLERRRTERSGKQFMLVLISGDDFQTDLGGLLLGGLLIQNVVAAISSNTRETDVLGWYEQDVALGLLMTEISQADAATIDTIIQKISLAAQRAVNSVAYHRLTLFFRVFPAGDNRAIEWR